MRWRKVRCTVCVQQGSKGDKDCRVVVVVVNVSLDIGVIFLSVENRVTDMLTWIIRWASSRWLSEGDYMES